MADGDSGSTGNAGGRGVETGCWSTIVFMILEKDCRGTNDCMAAFSQQISPPLGIPCATCSVFRCASAVAYINIKP